MVLVPPKSPKELLHFFLITNLYLLITFFMGALMLACSQSKAACHYTIVSMPSQFQDSAIYWLLGFINLFTLSTFFYIYFLVFDYCRSKSLSKALPHLIYAALIFSLSFSSFFFLKNHTEYPLQATIVIIIIFVTMMLAISRVCYGCHYLTVSALKKMNVSDAEKKSTILWNALVFSILLLFMGKSIYTDMSSKAAPQEKSASIPKLKKE